MEGSEDLLIKEIYATYVISAVKEYSQNNTNIIYNDSFNAGKRLIRFKVKNHKKEYYEFFYDGKSNLRKIDENNNATLLFSEKCELDNNSISNIIDKWITTILNNDNNIDLVEGKLFEVKLNKYERNREARQLCLNHYGYKCQICNFDFEKVYGLSFKNIIQVHHIVPISSIKKEYKIDPIKDLIPVCPNCHVALHSKKDGVYTPNELKEIMKNGK